MLPHDDDARRPGLRRLREANAASVLDVLWDGATVTGTDLMATTGLSRATVHDVCEELIGLGWVREAQNQREHGDYRKGRPARRYAFDGRGAVVVGVDAGQHRISASASDLRGTTLGRSERATSWEESATGARSASLARTVRDALTAAGTDEQHLLVVAVGVPAPVAADGRTPARGNEFWERMNPDIAVALARDHGWTVLVDNDANLAALAEGWRGHGRGAASYVTLLAGERFGAGIVEDGRLLRGARGGAGEMRYLDLVDGVGSSDGIAVRVREGARAAGHREAEAVFEAAAAGDEVALAVLEEVGAVLARVIATLAIVVDAERIVVAGAVAEAASTVLDVAVRDLPRYVDPPLPQVLASELGADVVVVGAVKRAIDRVRSHALRTQLPGG